MCSKARRGTTESPPPLDEEPTNGGHVLTSQLSHNRPLNALGESDLRLLLPFAEVVELETGTILVETGDDVIYTDSPTSGVMITLILVRHDGAVAAAAPIGKEGVVSGIVSARHQPAFARVTVQLPGVCIRIEAARLAEAKGRSPHFRDLLSAMPMHSCTYCTIIRV